MKRRNFVQGTVLGAGAASTLISANPHQAYGEDASSLARSQESPSIRWRMATSWPKSLQILYEAADLLCQQVSKMTNGQFVITPYPAGELADGLKVLDVVQDGTVECSHTASYYFLNRNIALAFGTTLPFGMTASQQNAWLYYGGGLEAMRKLYRDLGIINFPGGNTGTQMGGWFKKEVNTIQDFQGLRMRIPGLGGKILERLGAEIVVLPGNEIFSALETGEIEAAEWKNPHADRMLGLDKVAPYYYYPGWWEPGTSYEFQVNLKLWESLPRTYQEIFTAAAADANAKMLAKFNSVNGEILSQLQRNGITLLPFSQDILNASHAMAYEMYEEIASQNTEFRNIYEQWKRFQGQISLWHEVSEISFSTFSMRRDYP